MLWMPMMLMSEMVALGAMSLYSMPLEPAPFPAASATYTQYVRQSADPFTLSYTYIEVGYYSTDIDVIDERTDAFRARASLGLLDFLFLFVDYAREDLDFDGGRADADSYGLGVGAHFDIAERLDAVGELSWVYDDLDSDTFSDLDGSNSGWTAFAGARWLAVPADRGGLELNGGFRWMDRQALLSDDEVGAWEAGARLHFLTRLSVGAKYEFLEDDSRWGADLRFSF